MKREDRLSAGMSPEEINRVYSVLSKAFSERREKLREQEARLNATIPNGRGIGENENQKNYR